MPYREPTLIPPARPPLLARLRARAAWLWRRATWSPERPAPASSPRLDAWFVHAAVLTLMATPVVTLWLWFALSLSPAAREADAVLLLFYLWAVHAVVATVRVWLHAADPPAVLVVHLRTLPAVAFLAFPVACAASLARC